MRGSNVRTFETCEFQMSVIVQSSQMCLLERLLVTKSICRWRGEIELKKILVEYSLKKIELRRKVEEVVNFKTFPRVNATT